MDRVQQITGRDLVVYATDFATQNQLKAQITGNLTSISPQDKDGFDTITRNLSGGTLDVLLYSPGGSPEVTESIVDLLRHRFSHIRFIIPNMAKSAATMLSLSGNQILMDDMSELGPIDPQLAIRGRYIPAQAILDQFATAQRQISADRNTLPTWVPILQEYGPGLLSICENVLALSEELVSEWLKRYMFAGERGAGQKARRIARHLNNHNHFRTHSRYVGITELTSLGVKVFDMRTWPELQEAVHDVYTALMLTFDSTGACKIFENSHGEAQVVSVQVTPPAQPGPPTP